MPGRLRRGRAAAPAPGRPLAAVERAIAAGATSRAEIAAATGLTADTVAAAMAHLERTGRLAREALAAPCAAAGCTGCPAADAGAC
ncbi:FeoC-like transcriptional regulator, partial [Corynebacterium sphenisci]|uniref:FeoC-like transcriptional regulator n=1 Tax=Corynebacterium sphenisci TaxID=191493 RepID=UPI0026DF2444